MAQPSFPSSSPNITSVYEARQRGNLSLRALVPFFFYFLVGDRKTGKGPKRKALDWIRSDPTHCFRENGAPCLKINLRFHRQLKHSSAK